MMCEVKDIMTNQIFTDLSVDNVAEMLNIAKQTVYRAISEDLIIHKRFRIMVTGNGTRIKSNLPECLLAEWDEVAARFRKLKRCAE